MLPLKRQESLLQRYAVKEASSLTFPHDVHTDASTALAGLLILVSRGNWVWTVLHASCDYLTLYTGDPRYGSMHSNRLGSIFLEEASVELENEKLLTVTTKTRHIYQFRGRTKEQMLKWKEAIEKSIKETPSVKQLFADWKKSDAGSKDLINCLPRQAFPEKLAEGDDTKYTALNSLLQWRFILLQFPFVSKNGNYLALFEYTLESRQRAWSVAKVVGNRLTLLVLFGSVGSILTQKFLDPLVSNKAKFEKLDIQFVGVTTGVSDSMEIDFPGPIYTDEKRALFNCLNCNYGIKFLLAPESLKEAVAALGKFKSKGDAGDRSQLGGVALLGKEGLVYEWHQSWAGQDLPVNDMIRFAMQHVHTSPQDRWTVDEHEDRVWSEVADPMVNKESSIVAVVDAGWNYETGRNSNKYATPRPTIEETHLDMPVFRDYFVDRDASLAGLYVNGAEDTAYFGQTSEKLISGITEFLVVLEAEHVVASDQRKALAFSNVGQHRVVIANDAPNPIDSVKHQLFKNEENFVDVVEVPYDTTLQQKLLEMEKESIKERTQYKFGILYMKPGQEKDEDLLYSNETTSAAYEDFLLFLGEKIELATWDKFMGGLQNDRTGKHSIYTQFEDKEIMFHVATMLPFSHAEEQQLDRKRHLGNDVVMIVFKESGSQFDPTVLHSQFTQVIIVVEPVINQDDSVSYKVAVTAKSGVPPFGPFLPFPAVLPKTPETRQFLLTKMINAERSAMYSPSFREKMSRTRSVLLRSIYEDVMERSEEVGGLNTSSSGRGKKQKHFVRNSLQFVPTLTRPTQHATLKPATSNPSIAPLPEAVPLTSRPPVPAADKVLTFRCTVLPKVTDTTFKLEPTTTFTKLVAFAAECTEKPPEAISLYCNRRTLRGAADLFDLSNGDVIDIGITLPTLGE